MTAGIISVLQLLGETATQIINEVKVSNRVVYDVTSKSPTTIRNGSEGAYREVVSDSKGLYEQTAGPSNWRYG